MTSESDVKEAIKLGNATFGAINATVNCAGIGIAVKTLSKKGAHPLDQFEKVLKVQFMDFVLVNGLNPGVSVIGLS